MNVLARLKDVIFQLVYYLLVLSVGSIKDKNDTLCPYFTFLFIETPTTTYHNIAFCNIAD